MIVLPLLGTLVYVIAHGKERPERRIRDAAASQAHLYSHVRSIVTSSDGRAANVIQRRRQLLDSGATIRQEFDQLKAKALAWLPSMTQITGTA